MKKPVRWLSILLIVFTPMILASGNTIKIGDSFKELREKLGMPSNVIFMSNSKKEKYETVSFGSHDAVYVFDAAVNSTMDLKSNPNFKVCRIVKKTDVETGYSCH
ncbi:MAG: hypothetical protein ACPGSN_01510 [Psychrobium sp.]